MQYYTFEYANILVFLCAGVALGLVLLALSFLLSKERTLDSEKLSAYECGFDPFEDCRSEFNIHFYLINILFIVFTGWLFANAKTNVGKRLLGISYAGLHVSLPSLFLTYYIGGVFGPFYCAVLAIVPSGMLVEHITGTDIKIPEGILYRANSDIAFGMCCGAWVCVFLLLIFTDFTFVA